jgi:hypothetical protein
MTMMNRSADSKEFEDAFNADYSKPDEGDKWPDELPTKSLAEKLPEGEKVAGGDTFSVWEAAKKLVSRNGENDRAAAGNDGVSIKTHAAMKEAKVGPYEEQAASPSGGASVGRTQDELDATTRGVVQEMMKHNGYSEKKAAEEAYKRFPGVKRLYPKHFQ